MSGNHCDSDLTFSSPIQAGGTRPRRKLTAIQTKVLTLLCAMADEDCRDITVAMVAKRMKTSPSCAHYPLSVLARRGYALMVLERGKFIVTPCRRACGTVYTKQDTAIGPSHIEVTHGKPGAALGYILTESDTLPSGKKRDRSKEIAANKSPRRVLKAGMRVCLGCQRSFHSEGIGNRLCKPCIQRGYAL